MNHAQVSAQDVPPTIGVGGMLFPGATSAGLRYPCHVDCASGTRQCGGPGALAAVDFLEGATQEGDSWRRASVGVG